MRSLFLLLLMPVIAAHGAEIPIHVQYARTGGETFEEAEELGQKEIENGNPCVTKMKRELNELAQSDALRMAANSYISKTDEADQIGPHLVLRYLNESIELRFETRKPARIEDGKEKSPERVVLRKSVYLTKKSGSWKQRMDDAQCRVTDRSFKALLDVLKESELLQACKNRKVRLLEVSAKVSHYIHSYMPVSWIEEARKKLAEQRYDITGVLRQDNSIYREGNESYRECSKGLRLLEEEAAASVRVLNEVKAAKRSTDLPIHAIEELERTLTNSAQ